MVALEVQRADLPRIAAATEFSIVADGATVRVAHPGGAKALAALDTCEKDLAAAFEPDMKAIGEVAPETAEFAAAAGINPARWITQNDYPMEAVEKRLQGTTIARWVIGVDGRVKKCLITARSDHPGLDAVVCKALETRGRYRPARNADGRAIESMASRRVVWQLP